jgi:hypothetical protein
MSLATSNAFAALGDGKKKKKSSKEHEKKGKKDKPKVSSAELEKAIFSQPSLNISSWADEEDDDYIVPALPSNWEHHGVREARRGRNGGGVDGSTAAAAVRSQAAHGSWRPRCAQWAPARMHLTVAAPPAPPMHHACRTRQQPMVLQPKRVQTTSMSTITSMITTVMRCVAASVARHTLAAPRGAQRVARHLQQLQPPGGSIAVHALTAALLPARHMHTL